MVVDVVMVKVVFVAMVEDVFGYLGPKEWLGSATTPHETITTLSNGPRPHIYALCNAFCEVLFIGALSTC